MEQDFSAKPRLGELLCSTGKLSEKELDWALYAQNKTGQRLGQVLLAHGLVSRLELARALADLWGIPTLDLTTTKFDAQWLKSFNPQLLLEQGWVPVRRENDLCVVAVVEEPTPQLISSIRNVLGDIDLLVSAVSEWDLLYALRTFCSDAINNQAAFDLDKATPQGTARTAQFSPSRLWILPVLALLVACVFQPLWAVSAISVVVSLVLVGVCVKFVTSFTQKLPPGPKKVVPSTKPWTILVPFWHQPENVASIFESLKALSHPKERLEIICMFEERDRESLLAAKQAAPPDFFKFVTMPMAPPRTRGRALNVGLMLASGEFVAVVNADELLDPQALSVAESMFEQNQSLMSLSSRTTVSTVNPQALSSAVSIQMPSWGLPSLSTSGSFHRKIMLQDLVGFDPFNADPARDLALRALLLGKETTTIPAVSLRTVKPDEASGEVALTRRGCLQTSLTWLKRLGDFRPVLGDGKTFVLAAALLLPFFIAPVVLTASLLASLSLVALFADWFHFPLWLGGVPLLFLVASFLLSLAAGLTAAVQTGTSRKRFWRLPFWWTVQSFLLWRDLTRFSRQPVHWERPAHQMRQKADFVIANSDIPFDSIKLS